MPRVIDMLEHDNRSKRMDCCNICKKVGQPWPNFHAEQLEHYCDVEDAVPCSKLVTVCKKCHPSLPGHVAKRGYSLLGGLPTLRRRLRGIRWPWQLLQLGWIGVRDIYVIEACFKCPSNPYVSVSDMLIYTLLKELRKEHC